MMYLREQRKMIFSVGEPYSRLGMIACFAAGKFIWVYPPLRRGRFFLSFYKKCLEKYPVKDGTRKANEKSKEKAPKREKRQLKDGNRTLHGEVGLGGCQIEIPYSWSSRHLPIFSLHRNYRHFTRQRSGVFNLFWCGEHLNLVWRTHAPFDITVTVHVMRWWVKKGNLFHLAAISAKLVYLMLQSCLSSKEVSRSARNW